jgi:hypothetical protein
MSAPAWQYRRSRFNHDWLKNQYIPALGTLQNLLDGRIADMEYEARFVERTLTEWSMHREEALALPRDFECGMSPRRLFKRQPLSFCDEETIQWLGELTHGLWLARYPVIRWVTETYERAREADEAFEEFRVALLNGADLQTQGAARTLPLLCTNFYRACCKLAKAIEQFPSRVRVT